MMSLSDNGLADETSGAYLANTTVLLLVSAVSFIDSFRITTTPAGVAMVLAC